MKDYLKRHIWILSELYSNPQGLTYKDFSERWERSSQNTYGTSLPKRTFADCLRAIEETFDIDISSDARDGYRYRIVQRDWLEKDRVKDWLLSVFSVNKILQDSRGLRERVMFEDIPSGNVYLLRILDAMKKNHVIDIVYQDFFDTAPHDIVLEPYFVRVFKQRWYVIGVMRNLCEGEEPEELTRQGNVRRYALDRIKHLELTDITFTMPHDISIDSYFDGAFGIIVEPEEYDVELIRLKVTDINHRRQYLRSLPLHESQQEVEQYDDYSVFELRVMPTYDFIQQILTMSSEVEVLSPEHVRVEVLRWIREIVSVYEPTR